MELELNREHISCYESVLDTYVSQEETLEMIVPDACSDILRIVDAGGQISLTGKHVYDGGVSVSGTVNGWILYQPDDCQALCRMEVKLPFTIQTEGAGLCAAGRCRAVPVLRGMDARALNPRKILVRADVGACLQVFQPQELVVCRGIECDGKAGVQQLTCERTAYITAAVQEKEFTLYDDVRLTAGPGGEGNILSLNAQAWCSESKIIGNKLIFKGEAGLQVRYMVDSQVYAVHIPLAFSQIMEVENVGEGAECSIQMCVTDIEWEYANNDSRTLNVTLQLLGQAVVRDLRPLILLQDTYSTVYEMNTEQEMCHLAQLLEHSVRPQNMRELLETDCTVKNVIDADVTVCEVQQQRQDEQLVVTAQLRAHVLFLDEHDMIQSLTRIIAVSAQVDTPLHTRCHLSCVCPEEAFASPAAGGVEVRFNLEFHCLLTAQQSVPVVCAAKLTQARSTQAEHKPSVVLRLAMPGEGLWDIAKAYHTTKEHICQANQLETTDLPMGKMLLIPTLR